MHKFEAKAITALMHTFEKYRPVRQLVRTHKHAHSRTHIRFSSANTAILIIIEGQLQAFQRFPSSKLVLQTVGSRFVTLNYYENGSKTTCTHAQARTLTNTCSFYISQ
jgi:hypothetical protein